MNRPEYNNVTGNLVTLIQTEEDKKYSLEHNVTKFSSIIYNGKTITDCDEINKILGDEP